MLIRPTARCAKAYRLLRRDLPWGWRWVGEIGGELRVPRFGVLHRFLFDRPETADAVGQREDLDGGVQRQQREHREHVGDVLFVAGDEIPYELAVGAVAEDVERGTTQAAHLREQTEHRQ